MTGGVIAAARRATAPPAVPFELKGESNGGTATNNTSHGVSLPTITGGILANDVIVIWVTFSRGTSGVADLTVAGYTQIYDEQVTSSALTSGIACFSKKAVGGETLASIVASVSGTSTWVARVYRGALDIPAVVDPMTVAGAGSSPYFGNSVVIDTPGSLAITHLGGRGPSGGTVTPVWGGGAVASYSTASGRVAYLALAQQQVDSGTVTHSASVSNGQGGASTGLGTIVLKPAA